MKLVSPKNLLVSLLGCAFVVLKIVTFDGVADLFWILFIGYLSVKCLAAGLSQEAYDKDIKQAQQAKVLYRDLIWEICIRCGRYPDPSSPFHRPPGCDLPHNSVSPSCLDHPFAGSGRICGLVMLVCFKA